MKKSTIKFTKTRDVQLPTRGHEYDAGIDFFVPENYGNIHIKPLKGELIPSGIIAEVPKGYALIAFNKSGVATKYQLMVGACVVDESYRGEIHIHVINVGDQPVVIEPGDKLVQFILIPMFYDIIEEVKELELNTERGAGGFGSTGTN